MINTRKHKFAKRKKLTEQDCKEIYEETIYQGHDAGVSLCERKGYSIETFYKCLRNEGEIDPVWKHPDHQRKWSDDLIEKACDIIGQNPLLTLNEIIQKMQQQYNAPTIVDTTLSSYLKFSLITLKNVEYQPAARNSDQTKAQRVEFCEFLIENGNLNFIYVDEVGYSISVQRNKGRSKHGKPVIQKLPLSKTPNTSVCMGICRDEIILYENRNTAFDADSFRLFLRNLIQTILEKGIQNPCIILDNSPVHRPDDAINECKGKVQFKFLPPYSPNLSPIENIFGIIKKQMKKILATDLKDELIETFNLPRGQKTKARKEIIDSAFTLATSIITEEVLKDTYNHAGKYITLALEGKDI